MARTNRALVESYFGRFVKAINGKVATSYNDVGAYRLDYYAIGGGYGVERVHNAQGGVSSPLGHGRRKASEMVDTLAFAIDAIAESKGN